MTYSSGRSRLPSKTRCVEVEHPAGLLGESRVAREDPRVTGDYALVVLDLTLPGKDGLDVLAGIRARLPELPVIVLTARAAVEQRVEGLDRGANDYVTKPSRSRNSWPGCARNSARPASVKPRCSRRPTSAWI